jgi:hypothetical protein
MMPEPIQIKSEAKMIGWQRALSDGQFGIEPPSNITARRPDYITYDPATKRIIAWDSKYRSDGSAPTGDIPTAKLNAWLPAVKAAVVELRGPGGRKHPAGARQR